MTEPARETALISPDERFVRAWGAKVANRYYRADVVVAPNGNTVPPDFMEFTFLDDGRELTRFDFRMGAGAMLAPLGFTLEAISITELTAKQYAVLAGAT